jgi:PilZ domain
VLLFKRILNFKPEAVEASDNRQAQRFTVGHPFPFKAIVTLIGHDNDGQPIYDDRKGQEWAGRLTNISATGASIHLHAAAAGHRGEPCHFKLTLDEYLLEFPGTIAHFRSYPQYTSCGFSFDFPDFETQKAYLQLLEPVAIGSSLLAVDQTKVKQDTAGLLKEQYKGTNDASLTVWRQPPASEIYSFDYRMNEYGVRWSEGMTEVEAYGLSKLNLAGKKTASPFIHLTESELEEVHWLFCLAVPNLAKAVPLDIRKFLTTLVA